MKSVLYPLFYVVWLYRYLKLKFGFNALKDIKILSIEFSSVCNLRCKYCFLEQNDRTRFLDICIYEKMIKEIAENPKYKIKVMEWPISGEFFVYPEYKKVVDITKKYWDANPHFRPHIILNENLMLLNEEKVDLILGSGIVCQIICSIDGHDNKTFEDMRPPAKFSTLVRNMDLLVRKNKELEKPVFLQINNGRDAESFGKKFSDEMRKIVNMGDVVTRWEPESWNESFCQSEKRIKPAKGLCSFVFNNVTLLSSGEISKCCMDLKGATVYSDLRENTLEQIWHSNKRLEFLSIMARNKREKIKGCCTCSITCVNNDNRYTNIVQVVKRKLLPIVKGKDCYFRPVK